MRACVRVCVQKRFEIGEWLRFNALNRPTTDRRVAVPGLPDQAYQTTDAVTKVGDNYHYSSNNNKNCNYNYKLALVLIKQTRRRRSQATVKTSHKQISKLAKEQGDRGRRKGGHTNNR